MTISAEVMPAFNSLDNLDTKRVLLRAASLGALRNLISQTPLDLDTDGPRRQPDGAVTIAATVTDEDLKTIEDAKHIEVIDLRDVVIRGMFKVDAFGNFDLGTVIPRR